MTELAMIIDTETPRIKNPVPMELAMLIIDHSPHEDGLAKVFHRYFNPECDIDLGALAAHHILPEDVEHEMPWAKFKLDIKAQYVVGHNVDFDLEAVYGGKDKIPTTLRRICTLALSRWAFPDIDSHKLSAMMYCVFGQTNATREMVREAHGALPDAYMALRLVNWLARHYDWTTWEEVWRGSETARIPTRMTFGKHGPKDGQPGIPLAEMIRKDRKYVVGWLLNLPDLDPYLRKAVEDLL